jgi:cyclopropane fatty-acyl-phospholipid synthase-like methyltransferase
MSALNSDNSSEGTAVAEAYYDSDDADNFYLNIWGGEDIHIGLYEETRDIAEASRRTVAHMADQIPDLNADIRILDIGAGYGGAARFLARDFGCRVVCLNLSEAQNATNRRLTAENELDDLIRVVHGSFEDVPEADESFDVVWSQDSILHSGDRAKVMSEAWRVLKPGGTLIFTDPMQADDCPDGVLQPVYDRIHLQSLGSFAWYGKAAQAQGFEVEMLENSTHNLRNHYARVREDLLMRYDEMKNVASADYLDRMIDGLGHWVDAADKGYLAWGLLQFRKPAA